MSQDEGSKTPAKSSSRLSLVLRLGLAFGLFGAVLYLVPIKDRISWDRVLGEGEVVGHLERDSDAGVVVFYADDEPAACARPELRGPLPEAHARVGPAQTCAIVGER